MCFSCSFMNSLLDGTENLIMLGMKLHFKSKPDMLPLCMAAVQTIYVKLNPSYGLVKSESRPNGCDRIYTSYTITS